LYFIHYFVSNEIDMPARAPATDEIIALGEQLRAQRKRIGVSATTVAEAAGMSRVTLHRIERGEPSVTMGAYLNAAALRLELGVAAGPAPAQAGRSKGEEALPEGIRLVDYPQLARLAWQFQGASEVTLAEALNLYERNWRHIEQDAPAPPERRLIERLVASLGRGRLLV
jgi:transcriptional regulator with XRE-family HTH domain